MKAVEISSIQAFDDEDKLINEEEEEFESLVGNRNGLSIIEKKRQEGSASKNNVRKVLVTLIVIACCVLIASKLRSSKNDELIKAPSNDDLSIRLTGNDTTTNTTPIEIQMEQSNSTLDSDEVAKPSKEENKAEIDLNSSDANASDGKIELENSAKANETNTTESEVAVVAVEDEKHVENENSSNDVESPKPSEDESLEIYALKGFRKPEPKLSNKYIPRGLPMSEDERKKLEEKWGAWKLQAPPIVEDLDPSSYPNGDVPREAFPQNAWQTNPEYLKDWLPESIALTERAMEAILAEYGNGPDDIPNKSFEERSFMFGVSILETRDAWKKPPYNFKNPPGNAGFATQATLDAIKRRLLHSIMLEDSFIVVMGGHSAAAGHGNHFQQSYTLQIQAILEPVLARLGVYHQSHNFGMGGLGTSQNSLAAGDIYGKHIDVLIWDSGMTEPDNPSKDLFVRQAVLSGEKIPVIWGEPNPEYQAKVPELGAVLTGGGGMCSAGLPWTSDAEQVKSVPWAARYLQCTTEARQLCKDSTYDGVCWLPRDDGVYPEGQKWYPGGRASWHPGNRYHQLAGRVIAFNILLQLHTGLMEWSKTPDYALPDELWHLTDEFERMREAVMNTTSSACFGSLFPEGACTIPLKGRTEFTPRYNPVETSIRSIVMEGVKITDPNPNLYDPPDVRLTVLDPPEGQVNVLRIIENGLPYAPNKARQLALEGKTPPARKMRRLVKSKTDLPPGQGWGLDTKSAPDNCDGSWDSFCGRETKNDCILAGHNDHRGGLMFDSYSGWLKLNLENVTYGLIFARIEDWTGAWMNPGTAGFKCENNNNCENANRQLESGERRHLGSNNCDSFVFEFAIDGKVTSWDKTAWDANRKQPQRVVHLWTFLDDRSYTANKDDKNVELAIRLTGCGQETTFTLTHVYWA